jgi:hypothetical protein
MDASGALSASAQVAITLAGFAGVVAAFGERGVREWTAFDRFRLRLMLASSSYPTMLSLAGLLLLNTGMPDGLRWRVLSALAAATLVGVNLLNVPQFRAFSTGGMGEITRGSRRMFTFTVIVGNLTLVLLIGNAVWLAAFWPFFFAIVVGIGLALVQFVRLIVMH